MYLFYMYIMEKLTGLNHPIVFSVSRFCTLSDVILFGALGKF